MVVDPPPPQKFHGTVLSDVYGTGPGIVIIKGATFGTDVILTGLLMETLEELPEMVTMETLL